MRGGKRALARLFDAVPLRDVASMRMLAVPHVPRWACRAPPWGYPMVTTSRLKSDAQMGNDEFHSQRRPHWWAKVVVGGTGGSLLSLPMIRGNNPLDCTVSVLPGTIVQVGIGNAVLGTVVTTAIEETAAPSLSLSPLKTQAQAAIEFSDLVCSWAMLPSVPALAEAKAEYLAARERELSKRR